MEREQTKQLWKKKQFIVKCHHITAALRPNNTSETDEASWTKFVYTLCTVPLKFSERIHKEKQWFAIYLLLSSMPDAGTPILIRHY